MCDHPANIPDGTILITDAGCAFVGVRAGRALYDYARLHKHFAEHEEMAQFDEDPMDDAAADWISYNCADFIK